MRRSAGHSEPQLFQVEEEPRLVLASGATLLRGFALPHVTEILSALAAVTSKAPFRHMVTPGGHTMSVAMTNCGRAGWVTDRAGYRYEEIDPTSSLPWPPMPEVFLSLAQQAASEGGYDDFDPDACLINRYAPGARLTLHQDKNENDFHAPIVSVSFGLQAKFLFGGLNRNDKPQRVMLNHGDVVVGGGKSRLAYHGVDILKGGEHPAMGRARINLTFRKAR